MKSDFLILKLSEILDGKMITQSTNSPDLSGPSEVKIKFETYSEGQKFWDLLCKVHKKSEQLTKE